MWTVYSNPLLGLFGTAEVFAGKRFFVSEAGPQGLKPNVTYFALIVATFIKNQCRPAGACLHFFMVSQGSAALHPGLSCGRASGALVFRSPK